MMSPEAFNILQLKNRVSYLESRELSKWRLAEAKAIEWALSELVEKYPHESDEAERAFSKLVEKRNQRQREMESQ
jgi:hypothetical protein